MRGARVFACSASAILSKVPMAKLVPALNAHLPPDIRAVDIQPIAGRISTRGVRRPRQRPPLLYLNARVDDPFTFGHLLPGRPAADRDRHAGRRKTVVGTHDFSALPVASGSSAAAYGDTVRLITDCTVIQSGNQIVHFRHSGRLPVAQYVAHLAGTLSGRRAAQAHAGSIPALLESRDRRARPGRRFARNGAVLEKVEYPGFRTPFCVGRRPGRPLAPMECAPTDSVCRGGGMPRLSFPQLPAGPTSRYRNEGGAMNEIGKNEFGAAAADAQRGNRTSPRSRYRGFRD